MTSDAVPVISAVPELPGFLIDSGFSGHGFGIGPGAGKLMADLLTGTPPIVDPAPYRYQRVASMTSDGRLLARLGSGTRRLLAGLVQAGRRP